MKHILVLAPPEDRDARAVALATRLATRTGARLTLLRVLEESLGTGTSRRRTDPGRPLRDLLEEAELARLEALAESPRAAGVDCSVTLRWGVTWEAVLEVARSDGPDLVVKPASGVGRAGHVFFGATALHLFRRCPCPVWVVGEESRLPEQVLAAIDPGGAPSRRAAASRILDWAERVVDWSEAELHVATAWQPTGAEVLRGVLDDAEWNAYHEEAHQRAAADLDALLAERSSALPRDRVRLLPGTAVDALPAFANESRIDLIVMGTRGREGRVGDLLGETAETIIRQVRSSILTIPPDTHETHETEAES
ncbi:MAG: universal stress protein [Spirochaetaceae bacterium]|nr:universal stress protein [Myxococcales bacterium]MCB9722470.1 universal stress protein [Spirochaetaceae bacterium]